MALDPAPIQEFTTAQNGRFPQVWIRWFSKVYQVVVAGNFSSITIPAVGGDITLGMENSTVLCDATSAPFSVFLPNVAQFSGYKFNIKKIDASANDVTIDGNGANIDGSATRLLSGAGLPAVTLHSNGTEWFII